MFVIEIFAVAVERVHGQGPPRLLLFQLACLFPLSVQYAYALLMNYSAVWFEFCFLDQCNSL